MFTKDRFIKILDEIFLNVKKLVKNPFFKKWIKPVLLRFSFKLIVKVLWDLFF